MNIYTRVVREERFSVRVQYRLAQLQQDKRKTQVGLGRGQELTLTRKTETVPLTVAFISEPCRVKSYELTLNPNFGYNYERFAVRVQYRLAPLRHDTHEQRVNPS